MATSSNPVSATKTATQRDQAITAAYGSAGDSITHSAATSRVQVGNLLSPKWEIQYRVGSGAWETVGPGKSKWLDIDLSTTTLKVRRSEFALASVTVGLIIEGLPTSLVAATGGGATVDVGAVSGAGIPFASLPAAASVPGAVYKINDFGRGVWVESNGTSWMPQGGCQVIYNLPAEVQMALNSTQQPLCSVTLPAGLWCHGSYLRGTLGLDRLPGTSDSLLVRVKVAGQSVVTPGVNTSSVTYGADWAIGRTAATGVRKLGGGAAGATSFIGVNTVARPAAAVVADMDANATVVEVTGQLTAGTTEYGVLHTVTIYWIG